MFVSGLGDAFKNQEIMQFGVSGGKVRCQITPTMPILCPKWLGGQAQNIRKSYHWLAETFGQAIEGKLQILWKLWWPGRTLPLGGGGPDLWALTHIYIVTPTFSRKKFWFLHFRTAFLDNMPINKKPSTQISNATYNCLNKAKENKEIKGTLRDFHDAIHQVDSKTKELHEQK